VADSPDEENIRRLLAQHPGGLIWGPHRGKMRITPETQWGALAADLLPLVREAAQALANPQLPGANTHDQLTKRAARLAGLLDGDMDQVAARAAAVYMSSIWMGESWDSDRKLRGANDPLGQPLSDAMRQAASELISVLPAFARQFPSVMIIEEEREAFFAEAENLTAVKSTVEGARETNLIDPDDEAPVQEALAAGAGAGSVAAKAQKTAARSTRNLVLASVVSVSVGFVSSEMLGGVGDAFGLDLRAATAAFVQKEREQIEAIFASAPVDQQQAVEQSIDKILRETQTPSPQQKTKTHVVDRRPGKGDFTSIQAAINAAEPGDRIMVREGTYRESLRLSKALEIIGQGDRDYILVTTDKGVALHCDAPLARVAGLRFRREAGNADNKGYGIWITAGGAEIEDCVVESLSLACISVNGSGTTPALRRCHVRDGAQGGLFVNDGAQPVVEACRFVGNALAGVTVKGQATRATLRRCGAQNGKASGFFFQDGAGGVMEGCEAIGNTNSGVAIATGAAPLLRDCTLRVNRQSGLYVYEDGRGRVEGGRIAGNGGAGVFVQEGGAPEVTGCTITANAYGAVRIRDATSSGIFRDNDLHGNTLGAWDIAKGAKVERSGNTD